MNSAATKTRKAIKELEYTKKTYLENRGVGAIHLESGITQFDKLRLSVLELPGTSRSGGIKYCINS